MNYECAIYTGAIIQMMINTLEKKKHPHGGAKYCYDFSLLREIKDKITYFLDYTETSIETKTISIKITKIITQVNNKNISFPMITKTLGILLNYFDCDCSSHEKAQYALSLRYDLYLILTKNVKLTIFQKKLFELFLNPRFPSKKQLFIFLFEAMVSYFSLEIFGSAVYDIDNANDLDVTGDYVGIRKLWDDLILFFHITMDQSNNSN